MAKFKKKPVVIEAVQLRWDTWPEMCEFANVGYLSKGQPEGEMGPNNSIGLLIPTLEGTMMAQENDWVIKGVNGELYPCKPDIFEKSYEAVQEDIPCELPTIDPEVKKVLEMMKENEEEIKKYLGWY